MAKGGPGRGQNRGPGMPKGGAAAEAPASEAKEGAPASPATAAKEAGPPPGAWKTATAEETRRTTERAIEVIKKGLEENPEAQKDGKPYLPVVWAKEFKPLLGPYRKFVEKCSAFVVKPGDHLHLYTIRPREAGDTDEALAPTTADKTGWEVKMAKAWDAYLHMRKRGDRNPEEFVRLARLLAAQCIVKGEGETRSELKKRKAILEAAIRGEGEGEEAEVEPPKKKAKATAAEEEPPKKAKAKPVAEAVAEEERGKKKAKARAAEVEEEEAPKKKKKKKKAKVSAAAGPEAPAKKLKKKKKKPAA